jgi:hypothetical protein
LNAPSPETFIMTSPVGETAFDSEGHLAWEERRTQTHEYPRVAPVEPRSAPLMASWNLAAALEQRSWGGPRRACVDDLKLRGQAVGDPFCTAAPVRANPSGVPRVSREKPAWLLPSAAKFSAFLAQLPGGDTE